MLLNLYKHEKEGCLSGLSDDDLKWIAQREGAFAERAKALLAKRGKMTLRRRLHNWLYTSKTVRENCG
jgi:hypothetical protein